MPLSRFTICLSLALTGCTADVTSTIGASSQATAAPQGSPSPAASPRPSAPAASATPGSTPKPSAAPVALPSPWPSGFPAKNPTSLATSAPTSLDGTVWAEAPADQPGLAKMPACDRTYNRYAFQDPGRDGKDVLMAMELYSPTILRFGPTDGRFVGNLEGGEWVFRGEITAPGPADAPETRPWIFRLKAQAGPALVGTAARTDEEAAASKRDVRLVPVDGGPCPTATP